MAHSGVLDVLRARQIAPGDRPRRARAAAVDRLSLEAGGVDPTGPVRLEQVLERCFYGFALTGNWDVAQAYSAAADLTAKGVRGLTLPMFEELTAKITGVDQNLVALWYDAQRVRMAHGLPAETIEQFFHDDASILDRIGQDNLSEADARLGLTRMSERHTVEHYREVCISGDCSRVDLLHAPPPGSGNPLGGVRLDQPLTGAALRAVKLDAAKGTIVLVGERDFLARGLKMRDFAMALWLVFGPQPEDPAFSLDPDDIRNPHGPWLRARYIPVTLQGHSFGADLFLADLRLKELSFQTILNPDGKLKEWKSAVPAFHSYAELAMNEPLTSAGHSQWARFWIVAGQITSRRAGDTLLFDARMAVKARREVPDVTSPTGLRDIETDPKSLEARWASMATDHYDELAAESPALARVREMAVAIGIAKSLKDAGAKVNLARVIDLLNSDRTRTIAKINAFSLRWRTRSESPFRDGNRQGVRIETRELHLFGGVDLKVTPRAIPDDGGVARGMDKALEIASHLANPRAKIVRFEYAGARLEAATLPLLSR